MKESIAQAFIVGIILFFFGILILLFFGSINYSKAFKAKNRIITIIEKYGTFSDDAKEEISTDLRTAGYQAGTDAYQRCDKIRKEAGNTSDQADLIYPPNDNTRNYEYCVIKMNSKLGNYYQVVTFMEFKIPLMGRLRFAVKGETKVLYETISG